MLKAMPYCCGAKFGALNVCSFFVLDNAAGPRQTHL
jgi:hypothetical protein